MQNANFKKSIFVVEKQYYETYFHDYLESIRQAFPRFQIVPIPFAVFQQRENDHLLDQLFINPLVSNIIWIQRCPIPPPVVANFKQKYGSAIRWYVLNMEQLSSVNHYQYICDLMYHPNSSSYIDGIIDYQYDNKSFFLKKMRDQHDHPEQLPLSYHILPYQLNDRENAEQDKIYDCAMIGMNSDRRRNIYQQLLKRGVRVLNVEGWGFMRDNLLFRCKVLVNVHFSEDYQIYETIRCDRCTWNNMIVVTEESFSDSQQDSTNSNKILEKYRIDCAYENIVDMVKHVLDHYDAMYQHIFGGTFEQERKQIQDNRRNIDFI